MSDVNANIGINFETQKALASLRQLQAGISRFNQTLTAGNADAADAQKALNAQLMQSVNATGKFVASIKTVSSSTTAFTDALEKNKLSMKEYFRFTAAAATSNTKTFSKFFASERQIFNRAARDRVKSLQSQYIQLTNANGDLVKVLQVVPKHLQGMSGQYADYATKVQMAAQRQQMMNQLIKQGSTQLLNFGKNTQWAGRQLMVGFTIPLMMLGGIASRTFMDMEKEVIKFKKVYGEMFTAEGDTDKAIESIKRLGQEFTKYGIAVKDTVAMASEAAAMGLSGTALTAQVTQATRLAVLGEVEQQQALQTTISLQNAFGISTEELANKINFLNAVENQTVTAIEDLTIAIPKAGPIVKQLGGSVEDLAFFLTAMKEGGINASEGANALKSGLASIINPTKQTSEMMAELGINIKGIVEGNAGNLRSTVLSVATALDTLDPLNRARAIEQMFGKFQFARISALFANITKDSSQAARALDLATMSAEELAIVSERELAKVEESVGAKFQKTIEQLKVELLPLGKAFLEAVTPVVKFASDMLSKFNGLSDGVKKAITVVIGVIGGLAPILLMSVGLVANGVANLIKFFGMLRGGMAKLNGQNNVLGGGFDYLTQQETENVAMSNQLHTSHQQLIETFNVEKISLDMLADAYGRTASQARALASSSPGLFNSPGPAAATRGLKFANGGVVPGTGNKDTVPAMLTPGEVVLTKDTVKNNPEIIAALQNDSFKKYNDGTGSQYQSRISGIVGSQSNPAWLAKELSRIEGLSESQLKRFAKNTGMATEATLEEIRLAVKDKFASILQDVKNELGKVTQGGMTQVGKRFDPEKGYSPMGSYFTGFDQQQRAQFSHVGQTETVRSSDLDKMNLTPEAQQGLDLLKELGMGGKDFRVADAYGFKLKGSINRAMADPTAAANYSKKYQSDLNTDMLADFKSRGSEKWREMVDMSGGNFDELKGQLDAFDSKLAQEIQDWITQHPDGLISDDIVIQLASKVESDFQTIGPELHAVIQRAKDTISAIRFSPTEQELSTANAAAEARGMGKSFFGPKTNNAKIANIEAREQGQVLGTGIINALEDTTETASPSRKTIEIGKDVARGLAVGMQSEEGNVRSQASQLADASLPQSVKRGAVILGNTNNSSINVLENTEDLVTSSADAADAQRIHADNVVTASDLAGAAADNTDQIVAATALGANAQMDAAVTAQQIADKDQQILAAKEQQLQAINNNNMQELANDGRLSQTDALKEASKFARDENGQIILGPGGPLTTKQIKDMKRGQRRMAVGKYSGKISGGLGLATMAAGMMGAPTQVTAGLGVASMATQFAPMLAGLTGPQGIAVAAVAVAGGLFLLNKRFQGAAKEQAKFVREISATTEKMQKIGEFTGQIGASQLMQRRREGGFSGGYIPRERKGQEFGLNFAEGELGKQMSQTFVKSINKFGAKEAARIFGTELAAYVSDGVLSAEQAQGIAFAIGSQMQDQNIIVDIEGQLSNIIGMNGADLTRDPLSVRVRLIAEADSQAQRALDEMKRVAQETTVSGADEAARLAGFMTNSVSLAQAQSDSMAKYYEDEKKVLEQQLQQTTNKEKQIEIQNKLNQLTQDALDAEQILNAEVLKRLNQSVATFQQEIQTSNIGMFSDLARRESAFFDSLKQSVRSAYAGTGQEKEADRMLERTAKVSDEFRKQGFESFNQGQDFEVRMNMLVANKLVSPTQANAFMDLFAGNLKDLQTTLDIGIQSRGAAKTSELLGIMARFEDKSAARTMAMNITMEDNETFDRLMNILGLANMLDGKEIDMDKMFGGAAGESRLRVLDDQFKALGEQADKLGDKEITTDFLVNFDQQYGTDTSKADLEFIQKEFAGDKKGQLNALRTYQMISQYVNSIDFDSPEAKKMFEQEAERRLLEGFRNRSDKSVTFEEYRVINYQLLLDETKSDFTLDKDGFIQTRFKAVIGESISTPTNIPPTEGATSGTTKNPLDFLDSLAMRIKNVRDASFNAQKPLQSMLAAFTSKKAQKDASKMFTIFDGLQQRLIKMKAPKEFRDMIMGMSAEDFGKLANLKGDKAIFNFEKGKPKTKANITGLTKTGRALMQTYREAQVGEFQVAQKEILDNVANQDKAFRMLIASGMSASDALAVVNDTAQAAAIASGALGKKGSTEMKQYVKDINTANDALAKQAVITNMIQKAEEFKLYQQMPELASTLAKAGMSADQINAALADPELSKYLIEDLKDGKIDAEEIADYLNSIEARKIIDIQVKYNSGDFAGAAEEGRSLVDEMFSVQEALIRTGVDARSAADVAQLNANNKELGDLNIKLATAQRAVAKMNEELADGQRAIELNYNRPIDDMQEQVNDLERTLETHPIFGNRVIKGLQDESTKLSNDLQVIGFQTEKINEKYDKQAEALQKVQEINQNIIRQQQQQLGLADALTQGDIAAAARAAQEMRAGDAQMFADTANEALQQSRQNEIDALRGTESGLSATEIADRQFAISQEIYKLENDPNRLAIQQQILDLQDKIYNLGEQREDQLLRLRDLEDKIYNYNEDIIEPIQNRIDLLTYENTIIQDRIDKLVNEITVLGLNKDEWVKINAKIDASALAAKNLDTAFGALLASATAIDAMWASILAKMASYGGGVPSGVSNAQNQIQQNQNPPTGAPRPEVSDSAIDALQNQVDTLTDLRTGISNSSALGFKLKEQIDELNFNIANGIVPGQTIVDEQSKLAGMRSSLSAVSRNSSGGGGGMLFMSNGGMVKPKYFARGSFVKGTDSVPAMLTPGEFVMSKYAVNSYGVDKMKAINSGQYSSDSVYNYSVNVSVQSDANPQQIADAVMRQIKQVDSQRIRGNRL